MQSSQSEPEAVLLWPGSGPPRGSIPGGQSPTGSEVRLSKVLTTVTSTAGGLGASSIHLLLSQEEQMILISGQEVRRPLGSRGQFLSTLEGRGKKRPCQRPHSALCQLIPQMGSLRLHNYSLGRCISQSCPFCLQNLHPLLSPSAQVTMKACTDAYLPLSLSDFLPAPLQENKYFPSAAGRGFKNTLAKSLLSPCFPLSLKPMASRPLHPLCSP